MRALITGITGMDGVNLSEYLLSLGYEVFGIIRRHSYSEGQDFRIAHLSDKIKTYYGDVTDVGSIEKVMKEVMPDEIYNLAAMSHVRVSFDVPAYTTEVNALGALNVLDAYKRIRPEAKFYQASSSEMFGNSIDADGYQRETTPMHPVSPYGCSKLFAYSAVRNYRNAYGLHCSNGILFNHSGKYRGSAFVEQKICKTAVMIKKGLAHKLELGNLNSSRDIGNSKDYVKAMHLILQQEKPGDYVVATGDTFSIENICWIVFSHLKMDWHDYVEIDLKYKRPEELNILKGDNAKIKSIGWSYENKTSDTLAEMINYWMVYFDPVKKDGIGYKLDRIPMGLSPAELKNMNF